MLLGFFAAAGAQAAPSCSPLLNRQQARLQDEKPQNLCQYAGQVVLVVNTASFCGFTPQYQALEALHTRYRSRGLVVLGFPSNDFGAQEPGANKDIAAFCENTFGVKFPMFVKSRVAAGAGADRNPLFAELARRTGEPARWNFHKYLIARDGQTVVSRASDVDPQSRGFVAEVEKTVGCAVNTLRLYLELTGSSRAGGASAMSVDITFGNMRAPSATELVAEALSNRA